MVLCAIPLLAMIPKSFRSRALGRPPLRTRRNGTARCPRTLPGLRTCYRTSRAQKTRRVLVRGSGGTMNRHTHIQPQKRAARDKRGPGAPHTHCRRTTSATRRPAREERTAHTQFKFECDRAPSECAGPGSRRGRRHGLQHDGDGAASRRRYGGGRVYMELTIDGWTSRPAGGLAWPDGVKASSMESPDGGTRPTGAKIAYLRYHLYRTAVGSIPYGTVAYVRCCASCGTAAAHG